MTLYVHLQGKFLTDIMTVGLLFIDPNGHLQGKFLTENVTGGPTVYRLYMAIFRASS